MKIQVNKKCLKELTKIPNKERQKVEKLVFDEFVNYSDLSQKIIDEAKNSPVTIPVQLSGALPLQSVWSY